jgi:hypothetical protein
MGLHPSFLFLPVHCALTMSLLMAASACGGSVDAADAEQPPVVVVAPLLDNDGRVTASDPRAVPTDAAAWNRSGLYATAEQARQLAAALGDGVLQIKVECCGIEAVDQATGMAWGLQAASSLPPDTPVLVSGLDLRLAAATANRLASGGLSHVWLVTP